VSEIPLEISPGEVKSRLENGEPLRLIDVREPEEHAICRIESARLIPMRSIPQHLSELDDDGPMLIVYCHHGIRSLNVVHWLRGQGLENSRSLAGGIDLWSIEVDPAVPRY